MTEESALGLILNDKDCDEIWLDYFVLKLECEIIKDMEEYERWRRKCLTIPCDGNFIFEIMKRDKINIEYILGAPDPFWQASYKDWGAEIDYSYSVIDPMNAIKRCIIKKKYNKDK